MASLLAGRIAERSWRSAVGAAIALAALLGMAGALAPPARAGGPIDLSGTWDVEYVLSCDAAITQTGSALSAGVDCGKSISGTLTGTFDSGTGAISLSGVLAGAVSVDANGTVSGDLGLAEGTFSAPPFVEEGGFTLTRTVSGSETDLTGDWEVAITGIFSDACQAAVEHAGDTVDAALDCGAIQSLSGTYDDATRALVLTAGGILNSDLTINATVAADGNSLDGTWALTNGLSGLVSGSRVSAPPFPIVTETPTATAPTATAPSGATPAATTTAAALPAAGVPPAEGGSMNPALWLLLAGGVASGAGAWLLRRRAAG